MSIIIKGPSEIEKMRTACRLAVDVLQMIEPYVQPGVTTEELDRRCHEHIVNVQQAIPAPLHYPGPYCEFPNSICTSVNHQVCHGIPGPRMLKSGDIVNLDITVIKDGWHGDMSRMFLVGETSVAARRLVRVAYECLCLGIEQVRPGNTLGDIGYAIQCHAERDGFSVVRDYCGHGIGEKFHEAPQVVHYGKRGDGIKLRPGMTFTIEPMINEPKGTYDGSVYDAHLVAEPIKAPKETKSAYKKRRAAWFKNKDWWAAIEVLEDKWTVVTKSGGLSAQWEHTLVVTESGVEVLTLYPGENIALRKP